MPPSSVTRETVSKLLQRRSHQRFLAARCGIANQGTFFDPATVPGLPSVASSFNNSYDYPLMTLIGSITQVDAQYNYKRDGSTFAQGEPLPRKFATDSYEFYAQDSWKVKSNLTIIYACAIHSFRRLGKPADWK